MSWGYERKKKHKSIPRNAVEIGYVAAYLNPEEGAPLDSDEISFSEEHDSYVMMVVPIWYSVKDFITQELEPNLK